MLSSFNINNQFLKFFTNNKTQLMEKINKVIEERVRPVLQMDGGDIIVNDVKDGVVIVTLKGHCSGCPSRRSTLNSGILGCLQEEIPKEIIGIREKDEINE